MHWKLFNSMVVAKVAGWRFEEFFVVILCILEDTTLFPISIPNPLNLQTSDPADNHYGETNPSSNRSVGCCADWLAVPLSTATTANFDDRTRSH
jgi:hypothetical protein